MFELIIKAIEVQLFIFNAYSLKDKRSVVRSLIEKIKNRFNVSICETDDLSLWNKATIAIACVSNAAAHCDQIMDKVINFIDGDDRVEVTNISTIM